VVRPHFTPFPISMKIPTPTIRRRRTGFTRLVGGLPQAESCGDAGISSLSSDICHRMWYIPVFIGADGLTPGSCQVIMPFASLIALAFSLNREDRRVSLLCRVYPLNRTLPAIAVRSNLTRLHHSLNATTWHSTQRLSTGGFGRHP
jgi:hypothetical protein